MAILNAKSYIWRLNPDFNKLTLKAARCASGFLSDDCLCPCSCVPLSWTDDCGTPQFLQRDCGGHDPGLAVFRIKYIFYCGSSPLLSFGYTLKRTVLHMHFIQIAAKFCDGTAVLLRTEEKKNFMNSYVQQEKVSRFLITEGNAAGLGVWMNLSFHPENPQKHLPPRHTKSVLQRAQKALYVYDIGNASFIITEIPSFGVYPTCELSPFSPTCTEILRGRIKRVHPRIRR